MRTSRDSDLDRLRLEYSTRETDFALTDLYSLLNKAHLFHVQQYTRHLVDLLQRNGLVPLGAKRVLEVGCGSGGVLLDWLRLGVDPANLHGVDLLPNRLKHARERLSGIPLLCADGRGLPYPEASFDLVLQFTVFSSILDLSVQQEMAREMLRVLRPQGAIIWYDFWLNPTNKQTRGIRPNQIRDLFPDCRCSFLRITLAPPLARRLVPFSWSLAILLEKFRFLNSHYLAIIRPN